MIEGKWKDPGTKDEEKWKISETHEKNSWDNAILQQQGEKYDEKTRNQKLND